MHVPLRLILWSLSGLVLGLTLLALGDRLDLGGRLGWAFDLLSHWPRHLLLASLVIGGVALWRRKRGPAITALAAAVINVVLVIGLGGFARPQAAPEGARLIRIASANVHGSPPALGQFVDLARDYGADIIAIYEAPNDLTDGLLPDIFPDLPDRILPSQRANGWPLIRRSLLAGRDIADLGVEMFDGSHGVLIHGRAGAVQIVATHPPSPGDPGLMHDRDQQLAAIAGLIDTLRPFIIAGDFNSTPWGRAYAAVPGERAGDPRFDGTFPAMFASLGLPIDHIKFGGGLILTDYRVGPDITSDHLPLFATFALPTNLPPDLPGN